MFSNKVFHPLTIREPEGYNRSSSFESLPTAILKLIQQTFQHVKYGTVYYNFIGYEKFQGFHNITDQINYFIALCNSVKVSANSIENRVCDSRDCSTICSLDARDS